MGSRNRFKSRKGGGNVEKPSISDKSSPFWIGKVVSFSDQQEQTSGVKAWGIRYKVRIMGDYSELEKVAGRDVIYATSALGVTDGSGAKNMLKTSKISQGDTVMGIFLADDEQGPIIQNVLPRSAKEEHGGGDFDPKSGFTDQTVPGLLGRQEFNEQDNVSTPGLKDCKGSRKGGGKGRGIPIKGLQQMGIDPNLPAQLNAIKKPATDIKFFGNEVVKYVGKAKTTSDIVSEMKGQGTSAAYTEIESVKGPLDNRQRFLIKDKMRIEDLAEAFVNDNTGPGKDYETVELARESSVYQGYLDQVEVIDEELNN